METKQVQAWKYQYPILGWAKLLISLCFLVLLTGCESDSDDAAAVDNNKLITTQFGKVMGIDASADTLSWRGIPFAKPPVGAQRWKAPQDPEPWTTTLSADEFGDFCPQYYDPNGGTSPTEVYGDEDCLYLNIWRPNTTDTDLPVYFWIHGGGNSIQMPILHKFSGANLAHISNVIVVTVNYRLGPFGWLSHPALMQGVDTADDSGNYGTLDLIKSLTWVKDNIKAFGGDPDNVTIAGESAGASNSLSLMISPPAAGLFHKVISESGGATTDTLTEGESHVNALLDRLLVADGTAADSTAAATERASMSNTDIDTYLRSKTAKQVIETYPPGSGGMISCPDKFADGTVFPSNGFDTFDAGTYTNKVPIILGTNKEESKLFMYSLDFMARIISGDASADEIELYNLAAGYSSDNWKVRGVDSLARKLTVHQSGTVFTYQFLWGAGGEDSVMPSPFGILLGAAHGMEIDFFFGNEDSLFSSYAFSEENKDGREALSAAMMSYAAQFARTGDPGSGIADDLLSWTTWSNTSGADKGILFDADYDDKILEMTTVELTDASVAATLEAEPRVDEIKSVLGY